MGSIFTRYCASCRTDSRSARGQNRMGRAPDGPSVLSPYRQQNQTRCPGRDAGAAPDLQTDTSDVAVGDILNHKLSNADRGEDNNDSTARSNLSVSIGLAM